ncbi:MAG TPA: hypothetical protein VHY08_15330 [Bacillota bacterium]|nr:hypothetical protein [Bacillota bacterium]
MGKHRYFVLALYPPSEYADIFKEKALQATFAPQLFEGASCGWSSCLVYQDIGNYFERPPKKLTGFLTSITKVVINNSMSNRILGDMTGGDGLRKITVVFIGLVIIIMAFGQWEAELPKSFVGNWNLLKRSGGDLSIKKWGVSHTIPLSGNHHPI